MRAFISVIVGVVVTTGAAQAFAGGGTFFGHERNAWGPNGYSVLIARVIAIRSLPGVRGDEGTHEVRLQPLATLAGKFDPTQERDLLTVMSINRGSGDTSINDVPPADALVLAVIEPGLLAGDPKRPCVWITPMFCRFMPGESSLVVLDGLGDKKIVETIARVRDARKHAEE